MTVKKLCLLRYSLLLSRQHNIKENKPRVLDTSALVHDPKSLLAYSDDIYICLTVLEELDNLKERLDKSVSADARVVIRMVDDWIILYFFSGLIF